MPVEGVFRLSECLMAEEVDSPTDLGYIGEFYGISETHHVVGIDEVLDFGTALFRNNGDDVEPYILLAIVGFYVFVGQADKRLAFLVVNRVLRLQDSVEGTALHLHDD